MATELNPFNYIRRRGRMTKSQDRGYAVLDQFRMDASAINQLGRPIGLEIGFGMGQGLLEWAEACRDWHLVGIELYQPGLGAAAMGLERAGFTHVGLVEEPAQALCAALDVDLLQEVRVFFPDPWPKKRHAKRRLIQPDFVQELGRVIAPGGCLKLATDWTPYAEWMREVMGGAADFVCELDAIRSAEDANVPADSGRSQTKFERRGANLGHDTHDLIYRLEGKNSPTTESK